MRIVALSNKQQGFTMTEVLISLVVSVTSLLALGKAQLSSLQHATNSFQYTVATIQAQNAIERIWPRICDIQRQPARFEDVNFRASLSQDMPSGFSLVLPNTYQDTMPITVTWQDGRIEDNNSVSLNASFPHLCQV
ncbi:type IV pilus modification PilV family protein [Shewanella sp. Koi 1]